MRTELDDEFAGRREAMVVNQLEARGIKDPRVLAAMRQVPRHLLVPPALAERAYDDTPLAIKEGQTISQPYVVAWMTELLNLKADDVVLEVGTGSGYQAAVLSRLAAKVYSVERIATLAESASERLRELGVSNVEVVVGDGSRGLPLHAPYDAVIVTAGSPGVPPLLFEQLAEGGRLVIPVGSSTLQVLTVVEKKRGRAVTSREGSVVFVPLVGRDGWEG